jgi:hypothetical protein
MLLALSLNVCKSVWLPPYNFFCTLRNYWKSGISIHPTAQICCLWFQKLSASIRRYPIIPLQRPYLSLVCFDLPPKIPPNGPVGHIICFMVRGLQLTSVVLEIQLLAWLSVFTRWTHCTQRSHTVEEEIWTIIFHGPKLQRNTDSTSYYWHEINLPR